MNTTFKSNSIFLFHKLCYHYIQSYNSLLIDSFNTRFWFGWLQFCWFYLAKFDFLLPFNHLPLVKSKATYMQINQLNYCSWTRTYNHLVRKRTLSYLDGWLFVYELSGCGFESSCSHSNFRVTQTSDFEPASSKEFLDIQAIIECGFTLKCVSDMIRTYNQLNYLQFFKSAKYVQIVLNLFKQLINPIISAKTMRILRWRDVLSFNLILFCTMVQTSMRLY